MQKGDLTTLARVKEWLSLKGSDASDALLSRLISSASRFIYGNLNRESFDVAVYDQTYDGGGASFMLVDAAPIIAIETLEIDGYGSPIPAYTNGGTGYRLEQSDVWGSRQRLSLVNATFSRGMANVRLRYRAGFQQTEEIVVPAAAQNASTIAVAVAGAWLSDLGAKIDGEDLVPVGPTDPITGDGYRAAGGVYTVPAAAAGKLLTVTYGCAPADIEQIVIELVGERFKVRDRIGQVSVAMAGQQTITFSQKDISAFAESVLANYRRSAPL